MRFTKMHGCGNDYIYVNCLIETIVNPPAVSKMVSDRHKGIGSDGLIMVCPSGEADFKMEILNADGSYAMMCGNGIRCVAKYVYDHAMTDKTHLAIDTRSGIKYLDLTVEDGLVTWVKVNMGAPIIKAEDVPVKFDKEQVIDEPVMIDGKEYRITCVSMGNPHCITYVDDTSSLDLEKIGPKFEFDPMFPERVNTEFIQILSRNEINMRVWERGSGETMACGTGACASVVACVLNGLTDEEVTVHLLGGDLKIFYDRENETVWMTGPATTVCEGDIDVSEVDIIE